MSRLAGCSSLAVPDCILRRTLAPFTTATDQRSQVVCRETLYLLDISRYTSDQGSSVYFPNTIFTGDNLYDVTLSDGDCRLRVTLDPRLNGLVEKYVLRRGLAVQNATLAPAMTGLTDRTENESFILVSVEMISSETKTNSDQDSLPWTGSSDVSGPLLANRKLFLPLWNNVDFHGDAWMKTPPPPEEQEETPTALRPTVTVKDLRQGFLAHDVWALRTIQRRLILRITAKSHLTYYGRADKNCAVPYKALLKAHDSSGSVSLVLWNSACVHWYRALKPGDVVSLSHFRVKNQFQSEGDDIEISVNSRNPATRIAPISEGSVAPDCLPPPAPASNFCDSEELPSRSPGTLCDVIGLLTFTGRAERMRKDSELLEYRWLRLEDGRSSCPIWIQLFATSQPQTHNHLHPLMVLLCSCLKVVQTAAGASYLTNTPFTQLHRSGKRKSQLPAVKQFLDWFRQQDEKRLLRSALIGGFFTYPPLPVSLEEYMRHRQGDPGFLQGAELLREIKTLCYRERRTFCIQATVSMVRYCRRGKENRCIFWRDTSSCLSSFSPSSSSKFLPSAVNHSTPRSLPSPASGRTCKRKLLLHSDTPQKGRPRATVQPEAGNKTAILFDTSMEFLQDTDEEEEDDDSSSYATCPSPPDPPRVFVETLAMRYDPAHEKKQVASVTMGGTLTCAAVFACEDYYTLSLKALSDGVCVDAIFLPQSSSSSLSPPSRSHGNTWASVLSHGAFSSHAPPPSPGDLIATATLLANQRLACLLDVCNLGGESTEVVISRAFRMT
ncbi:RPA-related protein RADX [Syngnathus scovelli]|uniref:RPA-related protein RADX n=1 Tax=Syngnathus scovelli TaxID=161590 RepID=UPI002110CCEE|nr:RPA-related protein RADX [Syngnathus scovelli]